jgi:DNA repair protein RadA/Sms
MTLQVLHSGRAMGSKTPPNGGPQAIRINEIEGDSEQRIQVPIGEFSRVLGGGIVPGSVVLIGGEPGIGKSTLLLQLSLALAAAGEVLYVSGEESIQQIKSRAVRLQPGAKLPENLFLLSEVNLDSILVAFEQLSPQIAIIDSIQTVFLPELESSAGSVSQVRECASRLQGHAKASGMGCFLVGHVTKEGVIAGPRILEHLVDSVLYLEGDSFHTFRLLRSIKNRYGASTEVGVFEMKKEGLLEVSDPSNAFLAERLPNAPGSAISVNMEGTRPLILEIQGLTSPTSFGNPRRTANGVDFNRLLLIIAVLNRRVGLKLSDQDILVNVVGGLKVSEPATDLAIAAALTSSMRDLPIPQDLALLGEVGLSGELRSVPQTSRRLQEAAKLGFGRAVVPAGKESKLESAGGLEILPARSLKEAIRVIFKQL